MSAVTTWEDAVAAGNLGGCDLEEIARQHGTPCYVYSAEMIKDACARMIEAAASLDARLRYAVKANGNIRVLRQIHEAGLGFDVASAVELERALTAGALPKRVILTGPGKSKADLERFISVGGEEVIADSPGEVERLRDIAVATRAQVTVGVRVNPDIEAGSHPHIRTGGSDSKFGVPPDEAFAMLVNIAETPGLLVGSLNCHIGSQVAECSPYQEACAILLGLRERLAEQGIETGLLDLGGGFPIGDCRCRPSADVFAQLVDWLATEHPRVPVGFQPGRSLVGRSGILLTRVEYVKRRHLIVDAAMTELMRPALYDSHHGVAMVGRKVAGAGEMDVVGPVCESADWLAHGVDLADARPGDLLAVFDAGAYAASMMSEYNGRLRPCEIMLSSSGVEVVRRRDTIDSALAAEQGAS